MVMIATGYVYAYFRGKCGDPFVAYCLGLAVGIANVPDCCQHIGQ